MPVPLVVIESPYRETVRPVLRYVRQLRREHPGDVISIVIPEYVVAHWWQHLLHNQTALRLKGRLLFEPSVTVTSVPWVLGAEPEERPVTDERPGHLPPQRGPARRVGAEAARARRFRLSRRRQLTGLVLALIAAAAADPARSTRSTTSWRSTRQVLLYLLAVVVDRDGRRPARRGRLGDRRGAADQLLLRRAGPHVHGRRPRPGGRARRLRRRRGARQRRDRARGPARARGRARPRRGGDDVGARRADLDGAGLAARGPRARARDVRDGVGDAEGARSGAPASGSTPSTRAGRRRARRRRFGSTSPVGPHAAAASAAARRCSPRTSASSRRSPRRRGPRTRAAS